MDEIILVNTAHPLEKEYVPEELVKVRIAFCWPVAEEKTKMVRTAARACERMVREAALDGVEICGISAYRSFDAQRDVFLRSVMKNGLEHARRYVAMPGTSEHQTGLAIDVGSKENGYELEESFAYTRTFAWILQNAYLYGFILRYPRECAAITGYAFEPWHLRFVGAELAGQMQNGKKCLEEMLVKC